MINIHSTTWWQFWARVLVIEVRSATWLVDQEISTIPTETWKPDNESDWKLLWCSTRRRPMCRIVSLPGRAERSSWRPTGGRSEDRDQVDHLSSSAQPAPPSCSVIVDTRSHGGSSPHADNTILPSLGSKGKWFYVYLERLRRLVWGNLRSKAPLIHN